MALPKAECHTYFKEVNYGTNNAEGSCMQKLIIISALVLCSIAKVSAQINVIAAVWMPKHYLDVRKDHPPRDDFWKRANFSDYLSPVASLRIHPGKQSMQTYGAENTPLIVKNTITSPGRTEWLLDHPVFTTGQSLQYEKATFSLINHQDDQQDLWLGISYPDGRKDSIQFAAVPAVSVETPLWQHANNYLTYLFKGKQFDIYDQQSHLLYSNIQSTADGKITGLPGVTAWNVFPNNTLQLTEEHQGTISYSSFTISFAGKNVALQPVQATGNLNQQLVLKEKPSIP